MSFKNLIQSGIYGIKELKTNRIVYVGSTKMRIVERIAHHYRDIRENKHGNPKLVELLKSGEYDVVALETGNFESRERLEKERYYTLFYNVCEEGFNINVGGSRRASNESPRYCKEYIKDDKFYKVYNFIKESYIDTRIDHKLRGEIIEFCNQSGYKEIRTTNFAISIRRFSFEVISLMTRRDYIIKVRNKT